MQTLGLTLTEIKHELTIEDFWEFEAAIAKERRIAAGRPLRKDVTPEGEKEYFRRLLMKAHGQGQNKPKTGNRKIVKRGKIRGR